MFYPPSEEIEAYIKAHSTSESDLHRRLTAETLHSTDAPQMQVGHIEGLFLCLLARSCGARRVLEIGTFTGYSALALASGIPDGGTVITCDIDAETTTIARRYWDQSPHGAKIDLRLGPALETIRNLDPGEPFDLVFIDADKQNYTRYWEAVLPRVRQNGQIIVDNVLWSGRVLAPVEPDDKAIAAFNERVRGDDRVQTVMLPVRDGITLAVKL
jgi:caffeoyl-CoA O-methyltransferase